MDIPVFEKATDATGEPQNEEIKIGRKLCGIHGYSTRLSMKSREDFPCSSGPRRTRSSSR